MMTCRHFEFEGPWNGEADAQALRQAETFYNECIHHGHPFVRLVKSGHVYTEGYWVEAGCEKYMSEVNWPDVVIKKHYNI